MLRLSLCCKTDISRQLQQFISQLYRHNRGTLVEMISQDQMTEKSFQFLNVLINEEESSSINTRRDHYYDHIQCNKVSVNVKFNNRSIDNFGLDLTDNMSLMELKHQVSLRVHVHVQFIRVTVRGAMLPNYKNSWSLRQLSVKHFE